jgi:hypothetical protein
MAAAGQDFERRLVMIMRESTPCRLPARGLLLVGLAAVLAVPGWSLSQQVIEVRPTETRRQTQREFEVQLLDGVGVTEARPDSQVLNVQLDAGESRIDRLERQLETLLKEVREIKKGGNAGESAKAKGMGLAQEYSVLLDHASATVVSGTESIVLSRVTYKMPRAKAEALAAFLKDQVKASVLETAVEGDLLSVTSTPEAQKTIGQFISLVTGKADGSLQMHYKAPLRAAEPSKP